MAKEKNKDLSAGDQDKVPGEASEKSPPIESKKVPVKRKLYYGGRHSRKINPGEKREDVLEGEEIKTHRKPDKK